VTVSFDFLNTEYNETCMYTIMMAISSYEPGLARFSLDAQSSIILILSILPVLHFYISIHLCRELFLNAICELLQLTFCVKIDLIQFQYGCHLDVCYWLLKYIQ